MRFAICNELYQDWPFEKAFAHAAQVGYTGIEIAPFTMADHVDQISESQCESIRKLAEKFGLEIVGLHWLLAKTEGLHLTSNDEDVRASTAEYLKKLTRVCGMLGGEVMVFGSPQQRNLAAGTDREQGMSRAAEVVSSIVPELESNSVTLALEPLGPEEGNFLLTAADGIELIERIGSDHVQLHLDVKAMCTEEKSIPQIIRESHEHLVHFHANDPNRRGPGMGEVDFVAIFETLHEVDYQGWISVEVFDYEPGVDALAGESFEYMRRVWAATSNHS